MKVVLITEGSRTIGFGHITRLTGIYHAFEEKGIMPKFYVNGDDTTSSLLAGKSVEIINWIDNESSLFEKIKDADIAVVDSYLANLEFYKKLSEMVGLLVSIDDNIRLPYPNGVVVNGTFESENWQFNKIEGVTYLFGSQYMPLRKAFWNIPEKKICDTVQSLMITFGGEDFRNMTPKVLKGLNEAYPNIRKKVIIGSAFNHVKEIEEYKNENVELIFSPDANDMKKIMLESDIAITAGGQTLYELAGCGVPAIAVQVADNQKNNIIGALKLGAIEFAGEWGDEELIFKIISHVDVLMSKAEREKRHKIGKSLVVNNSSKKDVEVFIEIFGEKSILVRTASANDVMPVLELSNENEVRSNSFNSEPISVENHKIWFAKKIQDYHTVFLIAEINNDFLGQIRFEIEKNKAVVGVSVRKNYRRYGFGKIIMKKSLDFLKKSRPNIISVFAYIKEDNIPSIKYFQSCKFLPVQEILFNGFKSWEYVYKYDEQ